MSLQCRLVFSFGGCAAEEDESATALKEDADDELDAAGDASSLEDKIEEELDADEENAVEDNWW